jgi:hypothetical protein
MDLPKTYSDMNNRQSELNAQSSQKDISQASASVVNVVSDILDEIVSENTSQEPFDTSLPIDDETKSLISQYNSKKPPQITINKYLMRILKYCMPEPSTMILCLIYIDKICENSNMQLTYLNIHRLILACMIIAIKFNEDDYYSNEYYAKVGGISMKEMNQLESNSLVLLDFNVFIDDILFDNYQKQLQE